MYSKTKRKRERATESGISIYRRVRKMRQAARAIRRARSNTRRAHPPRTPAEYNPARIISARPAAPRVKLILSNKFGPGTRPGAAGECARAKRFRIASPNGQI
ncbi:hypothetical protein EVAR_94099_1 [Eumeta japonica]|uniref:Uncharacterized protein n=1 Tax=Eumeta variegata TaxID=151549 RepID=A0A4C1V7U3_EUMVA|nr:hypothetical protein EVAR_94099_1 [Eumeta japonica]